MLGLLALIVVSLVGRSVATAAVEAPQLLCDEFIHAGEARGLWGEGRYAFRGESAAPHSLLSPIVFGPAQLAGSAEGVYSALKATNVLLVSLTGVPVFVMARRIMAPTWAAVAAGLALALPGMAFAGLVMTESAFFPAVALATLLMIRAVEEPSARWQLLALAGIGLAAAIRPQALILAPALIAAVPLRAMLDARSLGEPVRARPILGALRPLVPLVAAIAALILLLPAWRLARGGDLVGALGPYRAVVEADYTPGEILSSAGLHAAFLPVAAAVIPVTALIIMAWRAIGPGQTRDAKERAFLAVALTTLVGTLAVTIGFASAFTEGAIMERYFFSVLPLLMIVLALWLDRGLPRPPVATAVGAVVPVVVMAGVPFARYLDDGVPLDAPSAMVLPRIADVTGGGAIAVGVAVIALAALWVALATLAPRRVARVAVPVAVATALVVGSAAAADRIQEQSAFPRTLAGADPEWVDRAAGSDADVVYLDVGGEAPEAERGALALQAEFWNRSVRRWAFSGPTPCGLPAEAVALGDDGVVDLDAPGDHVVAPRELIVDGDRRAVAGRLALTRTGDPVSVIGRTEGVAADGWFGAEAAIVTLGGSGARALALDLDRPAWTGRAAPTPVEVAVLAESAAAPAAVRRVVVPAGGTRRVVVPLPPGPATIAVRSGRTFAIEDLGLAAPEPGRRFGARMGVSFLPVMP
ncbi:MAG: glycosyltransferase family 39 protein, partial [Miltoncostaeaceae bacterium]